MIEKLLKTAALAAPAFAMLALAQPANANGGSAAAGAVAASAGEANATQAAPAAAKRYCVNITPETGTRMSRRVCRTKAEWADEGIEVGGKK